MAQLNNTAKTPAQVITQRFMSNIEFRAVVFIGPEGDLLGSVKKEVINTAKRLGRVDVVGARIVRDNLSVTKGRLDNWVRLISSQGRNGYLVVENPSAAMCGWSEGEVRRAWSSLARMDALGVAVLDGEGPVHDDGFCCSNALVDDASGILYSYAESDLERSRRWNELIYSTY